VSASVGDSRAAPFLVADRSPGRSPLAASTKPAVRDCVRAPCAQPWSSFLIS